MVVTLDQFYIFIVWLDTAANYISIYGSDVCVFLVLAAIIFLNDMHCNKLAQMLTSNYQLLSTIQLYQGPISFVDGDVILFIYKIFDWLFFVF